MRSGPTPDERVGSRTRPSLRVGFLFIGYKGHEFDALDRHEVPSHRVFGARELAERGHRILYLRRARRRARWVPAALDWRAAQVWWLLRCRRRLDVLVATHEAAAVPALLLRRVGLLRLPIVVMTVAVPDQCRRRTTAARIARWALAQADLLTVYATAQVPAVSRCLHVEPSRVRFLPFGVDADFFTGQARPRRRWVLAVGTNPGKDFATLVRALPPGVPCTVVTDAANRRACEPFVDGKDVSFRSDVPISTLRDMYAEAGAVVLPLHDVDFSSGQTVLLENLAMNSPLVVSDVAAVRDYVDTLTAHVVPPGDVTTLRSAVLETLAATPQRHGRQKVLEGFTARHMAARVEEMLIELTAPSS